MATKKREHLEGFLNGLSKGSTYRLDPSTALELEIYGKVGSHGSKKSIIEDALNDYFKNNPIEKKMRQAALTLLEGGGE